MKFPWSRKKPALAEKPALPWSDMTLDRWRVSDVRVKFATDLLSSPMGRDMMAVIGNTMPPPDLSDPNRAAIEAGRVRGYMQAMHVILQMAVPIPVQMRMPEPTYESTVEDLMAEENA